MKITKMKRIKKFSDFLKKDKRFLVLFGGSGAGKSWAIAQKFIEKFYAEDNKRFLIVRKTLPSLKISAYRLIKDLLDVYSLPYRLNKSELTITDRSNEMLFKGLDDPEKIRSYEANYIWAEETPDLTYKDFTHLKLSLRKETTGINQMFLSFNPISVLHWLHKEFVEQINEDTIILHSTYEDNPFLSKATIKDLLDLEEKDRMFYKIYTLGEWGSLENIIFSNYEIINDFPKEFDEIIYGLDFGFNNPSALVEIGFKDGVPYEQELLYKSKLTNRDLISELELLIDDKNKYIFADSAEPARIEEIASAGFNIHPAKKGKGSVSRGIDFLQSEKSYVLYSSANLIKELQTYKYKEDKSGNIFDDPVSWRDHLMDARRMARWSFAKDVIGRPVGRVKVYG